jgi:hypothetical protein
LCLKFKLIKTATVRTAGFSVSKLYLANSAIVEEQVTSDVNLEI